jgi:acyl-CoA synthetase (AMP-forming)/AMP-acid ligase II
MKGYYRNPEATKEAFKGGFFHTGDLGVRFEDGTFAIADRAKGASYFSTPSMSNDDSRSAIVLLHPFLTLFSPFTTPSSFHTPLHIHLSADIIISGGENCSSLAIESVLAAHPDVLEVSVVARAHSKVLYFPSSLRSILTY